VSISVVILYIFRCTQTCVSKVSILFSFVAVSTVAAYVTMDEGVMGQVTVQGQENW
jgi:hypothetical protein